MERGNFVTSQKFDNKFVVVWSSGFLKEKHSTLVKFTNKIEQKNACL
jgi:hypothetical protein